MHKNNFGGNTMNKKLMMSIVVLVMIFSLFSLSFATMDSKTTATGSKPYTDVDGHWAAEAIYKWSDYGVIKGNNGLFRPSDFITRAEMACILDNMMGVDLCDKREIVINRNNP